MAKRTGILALALVIALPFAAFAGGESSSTCDTVYPVVLAHGMAATDDMFGMVDYWWGIEDALEDEGADVFITAVNCMDVSADKSAQFKEQVLEILAITGKEKVNIIGHSHGGIYTRYAISNLGLADKVASLTTYCTPHQGSSLADTIVTAAGPLDWLVGDLCDFVYSTLFGDSDPNSMDNGYEVTTSYMQNVFNPNTPDAEGVYYQSYATKIKLVATDMILGTTWLIMLPQEGANDGMVSVESAKWGNFRGVDSGAWWCGGVSHANAIGHFWGITPGFDAGAKMVGMVADLKTMGF